MVYAGASQFMALDLVRAGVSAGSIIFATFLLNLRHMMMSASLAVEFQNINKRFLPIVAFGITDETFSVISFNKEKISLPFVLTINILSYTSLSILIIRGILTATDGMKMATVVGVGISAIISYMKGNLVLSILAGIILSFITINTLV